MTMAGRMVATRTWTRRQPLTNRQVWSATGRRLSARIVIRRRLAMPVSLSWRRRRLVQRIAEGPRHGSLARHGQLTAPSTPAAVSGSSSVVILREREIEYRASAVPAGELAPASGGLNTSSPQLLRSLHEVLRERIVRERFLPRPPMSVRRPAPDSARQPGRLARRSERIFASQTVMVAAAITATPVSSAPRVQAVAWQRPRSLRSGSVVATLSTRTMPAFSRGPSVIGAEVNIHSGNGGRGLTQRRLRSTATSVRARRIETGPVVPVITRQEAMPLVFRTRAPGAESSAVASTTAPLVANAPMTTHPTSSRPVVAGARIMPRLSNSPATNAAAVIDPALVSRLTDDVMRRIEQRLRIERERRGL
ncbi:hypothetical protein [Mesorhizobium sp. M0011]|uniref:hypothetical protein n=1 Tax=Mesorhizobium sp. M0011 TaxID=2956839 RepID=UPI00333DD836